ncbi:MAG TPA: anhydro-N-acetylmuramic acid kinase [Bacteroidales bacterium]|nr:anhydro-N-acetylmuramic acid kinase [Bacteroidales bacterium]
MHLLNKSSSYRMIGLMSGTSLDGLDICYCSFQNTNSKWQYSILAAETIKYPIQLINQLKEAHKYTAEQITALDFSYGKFLGEQVKRFVSEHGIEADYIASHGHTVLHNPTQGYTLQIGKGAAIAASSGVPCISDFRSGDVSRGGQGAPLVPIGDKLLFHEFDICLNLGGIANISYNNTRGNRLAYDISVCNMLLNHLAGLAGKKFDCGGAIGKSGQIIPEMLQELENLEYYNQPSPKSLGREWFESHIIAILGRYSSYRLANLMRTAYEHISSRIAYDCNKLEKKNILATGGGAKNDFLMELIQEKIKASITIPDSNTIDFKEALIFAFLGVLYLQNEPGALASVTGAYSNSITGCLYH